jgi:hypothetical protein
MAIYDGTLGISIYLGIIIVFCLVCYFSTEKGKIIFNDLPKGLVLSFIFATCLFMPKFIWKFVFEIINYIGKYYFFVFLLLGIVLFIFSEKVRIKISYIIREKLHFFELSTWCIIFLTLSLINSSFLKLMEQKDNELCEKINQARIAYYKGMDSWNKTEGIGSDPYQEKKITVKYCRPVLIKNKIIYFIVSDKGLFILKDQFFITKKLFPNYKSSIKYSNSIIGKTFIIKPSYFSLFDSNLIQDHFPSTKCDIHGCQYINPFTFVEK